MSYSQETTEKISNFTNKAQTKIALLAVEMSEKIICDKEYSEYDGDVNSIIDLTDFIETLQNANLQWSEGDIARNIEYFNQKYDLVKYPLVNYVCTPEELDTDTPSGDFVTQLEFNAYKNVQSLKDTSQDDLITGLQDQINQLEFGSIIDEKLLEYLLIEDAFLPTNGDILIQIDQQDLDNINLIEQHINNADIHLSTEQIQLFQDLITHIANTNIHLSTEQVEDIDKIDQIEIDLDQLENDFNNLNISGADTIIVDGGNATNLAGGGNIIDGGNSLIDPDTPILDGGYSSGLDMADSGSGSGTPGQDGQDGQDGDRYATTSTTSLTIGTGTQNLTVETGLAYTVGQDVIIATDATNSMEGNLLSYDSVTGAMSVDVTTINGSGTFATWDINLGGAPGPAGQQGTILKADSDTSINGQQTGSINFNLTPSGSNWGFTPGHFVFLSESTFGYTKRGEVTALAGDVLTVNVTQATGGASASSTWNIVVEGKLGNTGPSGTDGATGATGDPGANGVTYDATSDSSNDISDGFKTFTINDPTDPRFTRNDYGFVEGQYVTMINRAVSTNHMIGLVTNFSIGSITTMTVFVTKSIGSGSGITTWDINLAGVPGQDGTDGNDGATGTQGDQGDAGNPFEIDLIRENLFDADITNAEGTPGATPLNPYVINVGVDQRTSATKNATSKYIAINLDIDGHAIAWNGSVWSDYGQFRGDPGTILTADLQGTIDTAGYNIGDIETVNLVSGPTYGFTDNHFFIMHNPSNSIVFRGKITNVNGLELTIRIDARENYSTLSASGWKLTISGEAGEIYTCDSNTSLAIGTGNKTFVLTGRNATGNNNFGYAIGDWVKAESSGTPGNYMIGQVVGITPSTREYTLSVSKTNGSGTFADWIVTLSGEPGADGVGGGGGEANTLSSVGNGVPLPAPKVGLDLRTKSLKSSDGSINISGEATEIDFTTSPDIGNTQTPTGGQFTISNLSFTNIDPTTSSPMTLDTDSGGFFMLIFNCDIEIPAGAQAEIGIFNQGTIQTRRAVQNNNSSSIKTTFNLSAVLGIYPTPQTFTMQARRIGTPQSILRNMQFIVYRLK